MSDIELTKPWVPLTGCRGNYDGAGYTISELELSGGGEVGLWDSLRECSIRNLRVKTSLVGITGSGSTTSIGILAGVSWNNFVLDNVVVSGKVTPNGATNAGGLIGLVGNNRKRFLHYVITAAEIIGGSGSKHGPVIGDASGQITYRESYGSSAWAGVAMNGDSNAATDANISVSQLGSVALLKGKTSGSGTRWDQLWFDGADGLPEFIQATPPPVGASGIVNGTVKIAGANASSDVLVVSAAKQGAMRAIVGNATSDPVTGDYAATLTGFTDPVYVLCMDDAGAVWNSSGAYVAGDRVYPTAAGHTGLVYQATIDGTSGATEPTWPAVIGDTVSDGTTNWAAIEHYQPVAHGPVHPQVIV